MSKVSAKTLWIVEDIYETRVVLKLLLERHGFLVSSVINLEDAVNALALLPALPDLALVDLRLAEDDQDYEGMKVLDKLKEKGVYAVVISGFLKENSGKFNGRPEVRRVVDKRNLSNEQFAEEEFISILNEAIAYGEADRQAEGKMLDQQARLRRIGSTV